MNSQELETATQMGTLLVVIWNDNGFSLIEWKQMAQFKRTSQVSFSNPEFVGYAESFATKGYRVEAAAGFAGILKEAVRQPTATVVDRPLHFHYSENLKLREQMGKRVCPI